MIKPVHWITGIATLMACMVSVVDAAVTVTTNSYRIDGNSAFELRHSMGQNRPKGWKPFMDAHTHWQIDWSFRMIAQNQVYRLRSVDTKTRIVLTLPEWKPGTNAPASLVQQWTNYYTALLAHEGGHIRIALAAEAEIRKRVNAIGPQPTGPALEELVNRTARKVLDEFGQREQQYDQKTSHGLTQGARFP